MAKSENGKSYNLLEFFLLLFKRDYWQMSDSELVEKAYHYKLEDWSYLDRFHLYNGMDHGDEPLTFWLDQPTREKIIEKLIKRDKFANSLLSLGLSIVAIIISILALIS